MVLQPFGIHHLAIQVRDLAVMSRFYEQVLRLPRSEERADDEGRPRAVWLSIGPANLVLEHVAGDTPVSGELESDAAGLHLFALKIDIADRESWRAHLRKHGVRLVGESPWSLFFRDPEGNRLAVTHYPDAELES